MDRNAKKKERAFDFGLLVSGIALAAIIIFIIVFAFIPRLGVSPSDRSADISSEVASEASPEAEMLRFVGILPCEDCDGIRTELVLRGDGTFRLAETHLGPIANAPVVQEGKWTTLKGNARDLNAIVYRINFDKLATPRNYLVLPEGNIAMVDEKQEPFPETAEYILVRQE